MPPREGPGRAGGPRAGAARGAGGDPGSEKVLQGAPCKSVVPLSENQRAPCWEISVSPVRQSACPLSEDQRTPCQKISVPLSENQRTPCQSQLGKEHGVDAIDTSCVLCFYIFTTEYIKHVEQYVIYCRVCVCVCVCVM